jgi:hypothetical protein
MIPLPAGAGRGRLHPLAATEGSVSTSYGSAARPCPGRACSRPKSACGVMSTGAEPVASLSRGESGTTSTARIIGRDGFRSQSASVHGAMPTSRAIVRDVRAAGLSPPRERRDLAGDHPRIPDGRRAPASAAVRRSLRESCERAGPWRLPPVVWRHHAPRRTSDARRGRGGEDLQCFHGLRGCVYTPRLWKYRTVTRSSG